MNEIIVVYGSTTGNTEEVATSIAGKFEGAKLANITSVTNQDFESADLIIAGGSTWGYGDHQDDWEEYIPNIEKLNLTGKKVALFGLGDQEAYPDTFVDSMGMMHDEFLKSGASIIGKTLKEDLEYSASKADEDEYLVGLAIDQDNQSDMTATRVERWVELLKKEI